MAKWDKIQEGRMEGLQLALKIVKQGGIEALEREIKFRGASGLNTKLSTRDISVASAKIKEMTVDTITVLGIAALHDCFGFGQVRCQRWKDKVDQAADYLMDDLATWDDYIREIKNLIGLELEIRWNN